MEKSIEHLYRLYRAPMVSYACGVLNNKLAAEDIVEDVFHALCEGRDKKGGVLHNPRSYLWLDRYKVKQAYEVLVNGSHSSYLARIIHNVTPLSVLTGSEILAAVDTVLDGLSYQYRNVFIMRYIRDMTIPEISETLGVSVIL